MLWLTGCNAFFGLEPTALQDAAACMPITSNFDDFEQPTSTPCSWGYLTQTACTATVVGGELTMPPSVGIDSTICVCGSGAPLTFTASFGVMVEVFAIATQMGEYSEFHVSDAAGGTEGWRVASTGGTSMLSFSRGSMRLGQVPFDASSRWWRIRPDDAGNAVIAEVSPEGRQWTAIAVDPTPPPAMVKLSFNEGTFQALSAPSTARIGSINICPP